MNKKNIGITIGLALIAYLMLWPVSVDPERWEAPTTDGYVGHFRENSRLSEAQQHPLGQYEGPEDVAWDGGEYLYASMAEGVILRIHLANETQEAWAHTKGRPLGMEFAPNGNLIVADALRGLLSVSPEGKVTVLTNSAGELPLGFADDVTVARDGKIYVTDASTKFRPADFESPLRASSFDILEHRPNGRIVVYDPATQSTEVLLAGLYFPNGIALANNDTELLFAETSQYRIMKFPLNGDPNAKPIPILENLPGFPDNINPGEEGRYWIGLVSPRNALLDACSSWPSLRRISDRIPKFLQPKPGHYGHVFAIDSTGKVVRNLQDPSGEISLTTGAIETPSRI